MTLKQFLKPDRRKIVLFIIFCVLAIILWVYGYFAMSAPLVKEGFLLTKAIFFNIITLLLLPYIHVITYFAVNPYVRYAILLINIVYWYLLSCLIVWIYDKVKKK